MRSDPLGILCFRDSALGEGKRCSNAFSVFGEEAAAIQNEKQLREDEARALITVYEGMIANQTIAVRRSQGGNIGPITVGSEVLWSR